MIKVTKFDGQDCFINPHLIETIESNPDTTITLSPARKLIVRDTVSTVIQRIIVYRRSIGISVSDAEAGKFIFENEE